MIAHPAMFDVSCDLVLHVSALLHHNRWRIGIPKRSRALICWKQALFVLELPSAVKAQWQQQGMIVIEPFPAVSSGLLITA